MKSRIIFSIALLIATQYSLTSQIPYWYAESDEVGFKEDEGGGVNTASTWLPRVFTLLQETPTTGFVNSSTPSDHSIYTLGMSGPEKLARLTAQSLLFDDNTVHRTFLDINGLELLNDDSRTSLKAYTSGNAGRLELFNGTTSSWLARIGPTETGINRGSLRLYGSDGFEKIEYTVDDDNDPIIETTNGVSLKSTDDTKADLILRGTSLSQTNGVIESDPDYTNSNLIFNSKGSVVINLDTDDSTPGLNSFAIDDGFLKLSVNEDNGMIMQRLSGSVSEPHFSIRDLSSDSYGRINIGNVGNQKWQIAGKPTGSSTQKYLLFHLTDTDGTTGDDMIQLRGDGNAFIRGVWAPISDIRLKKDIVKLENSLDGILKINGYHYNWKDPEKTTLQTGVIAQEIQKVFPNLVIENKNSELSVNYDGLIPHLIESIKSQQTAIAELKKEVAKLQSNK